MTQWNFKVFPPANIIHYKNALGTSTTFHGRSQDVLVTLCVRRISSKQPNVFKLDGWMDV